MFPPETHSTCADIEGTLLYDLQTKHVEDFKTIMKFLFEWHMPE